MYRVKRLLTVWWIANCAALTPSVAPAESDVAQSAGLLSALVPSMDPNASEAFSHWRLKWGGWLNAGVSYNANQPADRFNATASFSDRTEELQLNQLYQFLERSVVGNGSEWSWGGRLDFVFGSDAFYTRSMGDPADHWDAHLLHQRIYGIAFPQAYLELMVPVANGLRLKLGEFYTVIGNESVTAPDNFFYSHSYAMQFGEPFSHTGLLASYSLNSELELKAGAVTGSPYAGWDGSFQHRLENWGFIGGVNWNMPQTGSSLALSAAHGGLSEPDSRDVNLYSAVWKQEFAERWHVTLQHDYGWVRPSASGAGAEWYGVVGYLHYDLSERLGLGLRLEWFRDDDGVRVGVPARKPELQSQAANYYAATIGANWKPWPWLALRPSLRYDISDGWRAFDVGNSHQQLLVSTDLIIQF
ncbi:porin [Methylomonas sp. SURF-1]|uniref:Porin n=1 Tax=Methylomonas aurea TaxID=2952224 RepID=A0ABT1UE14_9GAMM|nr:porin [Methylomonas sp. SURF-1]MCQ8180463.1 porin [Methylomonas sp. SURF-1]